MTAEEKVIELIPLLTKIYDEYLCCDEESNKNVNDLNEKLYELFNDSNLDEQILSMISKLNGKEIFTTSYYFTDEFKKNPIRKILADYINQNCQLYFDYELIKNNIHKGEAIFDYCYNDDKNNIAKIEELLRINIRVLLKINYTFLTPDFVYKYMLDNDFISSCFLGENGEDNDLYKYSTYYLNDNRISNLLYKQLKDKLENNPYKYVNSSTLVKNNIELAKLILNIDSKFISYAGEKIRKNKDIMLELIKKDKEMYYYIDDSLKYDKDILHCID